MFHPKVERNYAGGMEDNYMRIKQEVAEIIDTEIERIYDIPELAYLLVVRDE